MLSDDGLGFLSWSPVAVALSDCRSHTYRLGVWKNESILIVCETSCLSVKLQQCEKLCCFNPPLRQSLLWFSLSLICICLLFYTSLSPSCSALFTYLSPPLSYLLLSPLFWHSLLSLVSILHLNPLSAPLHSSFPPCPFPSRWWLSLSPPPKFASPLSSLSSCQRQLYQVGLSLEYNSHSPCVRICHFATF